VTTPILDIRGLTMSFGALRVARDINLTLARGARHALIGPNGAGKTTFVNLITGVLRPNAGEIILNGEDVTRLSQAARTRRGIARTFQINQLFRGLTVVENLYLAIAERTRVADRLWRPAGAERALIEEAMDHLEALRLADDALRLVRELPYGRQRLVEVAIALAQHPKLLLLDEPAAGVPSVKTAPDTSTVMRCAKRKTMSMSCSMISTAMSGSRAAITSRMRWLSEDGTPAAGSSSRRSFGRCASAIATSTSRWRP
jgi:branched-chain amino acid transport system ATP-binding protein